MGVSNFLHEILRRTPDAIVFVSILHGDNQSAIEFGQGRVSVQKIRHLLVPQLYIRQLTRDGRLTIRF